MAVSTVAFTGDWVTAMHMHGLLVDQGLHPHALQPNMQITHTGGEMGHPITLPNGEAERAARVLEDGGYGKWLV